jgi:hypothetical protein
MVTKSQVKLPQKKPMSITAIKRLLGEYEHTVANDSQYMMGEIMGDSCLLEGFIKAAKIQPYDRKAPDFNILSVLELADKEIFHSKILAWLLNKKGTHGQGNRFFSIFLMELAALGLSSEYAFLDYTVGKEEAGSSSRIDISVYENHNGWLVAQELIDFDMIGIATQIVNVSVIASCELEVKVNWMNGLRGQYPMSFLDKA